MSKSGKYMLSYYHADWKNMGDYTIRERGHAAPVVTVEPMYIAHLEDAQLPNGIWTARDDTAIIAVDPFDTPHGLSASGSSLELWGAACRRGCCHPKCTLEKCDSVSFTSNVSSMYYAVYCISHCFATGLLEAGRLLGGFSVGRISVGFLCACHFLVIQRGARGGDRQE